MPLRKIGKYYYIDIRIRKTGKRIRRSLYTTNKTEALERYQEEKEKILAKELKKDLKFEDFCKSYLKWAASSKPASVERESQRLEKIKAFFKKLGVELLSDISPYHVERLKLHLKEAGLSKATINRYLQILRGMFYKAIDWEIYQGNNPVKKVKFYRESSPIKVPSDRQMKKILKAAKEISDKPLSPLQKEFYDMVRLALNTGMRKSEILNLKWEDIRDGTVTVKGKGEKIREIPLNETALEIINKKPKLNEYVFDIPNRHQHDLLRRTVNQIKKKTDIDFHFHLLRHYFATKLVEKGVDFITISEILGHSKMTTSLIYSHTDKEKKKKAVELLIKGG